MVDEKKNAAPPPKDTVKPKATNKKSSKEQETKSTASTPSATRKTKTPVANAANKDVVTFSTNVFHNAAWLVYLNGIEVQSMAVSVQFGVWQIPTAQVTLPPHVMLQRLGFEDRIMVTIFYLDEFYAPGKPEYRLMGEYELIEWTYTNTGSGRAIQLSCRSPLQIFEQLKFYYMSSLDDIVTANMNVGASASDTITTTTVFYPQSLFHNGLVPMRSDRSEPSEVLDFITSPSGFIWNIFKALMGEINFPSEGATLDNDFVPQQACAIPGRNFFGRWLFKTNFYRRWTGLYGFDDGTSGATFPLLDAINNTEVMKAVQQQVGISVGSAGTAWELLQKVFGVMLMEVGTTPAPPIGQVDKTTRTYGGEFFDKGNNKTETYGAIYTHYVKPQCYFAVPPICNVIFPSMITSYSFAENYMAQPTRVYLGEQFLNELLTRTNNGDAIRAQTSQLLTTGYPQAVKLWMQAYITAPEQNTKNFLLWPEEFYKGPVVKHLSAPPWTWMLDEYYKALGKEKETDSDNETVNVGASQTESAPISVPPGEPFTKQTRADWINGDTKYPDKYIKGLRDIMFVYRKIVTKYVKALGMPSSMEPIILSTLMMESQGDPNALNLGKNRDGINASYACGLGQIMPIVSQAKKGIFSSKFNLLNDLVRRRVFTEDEAKRRAENIIEPDTNIACACVIYRMGMDRLGIKNNMVNIEYLNKNSPTGPNDIQCLALYYTQPDATVVLQRKVHAGTYKPNEVKFINAKEEKLKGEDYWQIRSRNMYLKWTQLVSIKQAGAGDAVVASASSPQVSQAQQAQLQSLVPNKPASENERWDLNTNDAGGFNNGQSQSLVSAAPDASLDEEDTSDSSERLLGGIFDLYAKYEYFKARYEPRSANISLAFDPYLVPGFPAVVFDSRVSKLDTVGYVMSVSHSWDAGSPGINTQVTLGYIRSFPEFLGIYKNGDYDVDIDGYLGLSSAYLTYPREPVYEVARFTQTEEVGSFYRHLFYPGARDLERDTHFDFETMLDVYTAEGKLVKDLHNWTWEEGMFVEPKDKYAKLFNSYDSAMTFIARPAATIDDFVKLRSGMSVKAIRAAEAAAHKKSGTVIDASTVRDDMTPNFFHLGSIKNTEKGAEYYSRIYGLRQGPEVNLDPVTYGQITGINYYAIKSDYQEPIMATNEWSNHDVDPGLADTRRDWDKVLRRYRRLMRSSELQR